MEATRLPAQPSGFVDGDPNRVIPFRQKEFKNAFLKWVILDDIKQRKATSKHLKRMFRIANSEVLNALPASNTTVGSWIDQMFQYFEPEIIAEVQTAQSRISLSFDGWGSKRDKISVVALVMHFINGKGEMVTRLAGLPELPGHGKTGVEQASVLLPLLQRFGITSHNIGYFVLDNALNNDTTLVELAKTLKFDPKQRRLRCMGHILNLIAEAYLFGQDTASFERDYNAAGAPARRQLWRQRGELGKLHNLVAHVMASGKRSELFEELQKTWNQGKAVDRSLKLVLDGGIRWNASYAMVTRALLLRDSLDIYATKLRVSKDAFDRETYDEDYLSDDEWPTLELISQQLEKLFLLTKSLEGNTRLNEGAGKPSHGALWEVLPAFEGIEWIGTNWSRTYGTNLKSERSVDSVS